MKKFSFEKLEFDDSFVAFLDVLGFSQLVYSDEEKQLQKIHFNFAMIEIILDKLRDELNKTSIEMGASEDTLFKLDYIIISDSIIITMKMIKYNFDDMTQELFESYNMLNKLGFEKLCERIIKIQRYLASQNIWLRGAISAGITHISTNKKQIIGKAYIRAYELEGKAKYQGLFLTQIYLKHYMLKVKMNLLNRFHLCLVGTIHLYRRIYHCF